MSKLAINSTSLTAIGDAIREKTKTTDLLTLDAMPAAIRSISGGGEVVFPDFEIKHDNDPNTDLQYLNAQGRYNDLIDFLVDHGSKVVVKGGQRMNYAFLESDYCKLEINGLNPDGSYTIVGNTYSMSMFQKYKGSKLPKVLGYNFADLRNFFNDAQNLSQESLNEFVENNEFTAYNGTLYQLGRCFWHCYRIRYIPEKLMNTFYATYTSNNLYCHNLNQQFTNCYCLDEVRNLPVGIQSFTSNVTDSPFDRCGHLKSFTFVPNQEVKWKSQVIEL